MTNADTDLRAGPNPRLLLMLVTVGILILAIALTSNIINNETGGISGAARSIGVALAIWCFIRPKTGLYIVTIEAFSLDFIKKIAVYYGTVDMMTIMEVLIVGMLAVSCTIGGIFIQSVVFRRYRLSRIHWAILGASVVVFASIVLDTKGTDGFNKAVENGFNAAIYMALALPMCLLLADRSQLEKLIRLQFWLATIWAAWGIKQYYLGFNPLEWFYAETGLSAVASEHMLRFADPRPFGFGSGASNYGVISAYLCYGLWKLWHGTRNRLGMTIGCAILAWGTVTSMQRTTLVMPFFVFLVYHLFKSERKTIWAYASTAVLFPIAVAYSDQLLNSLTNINEFIALPGRWGENVLVVSTYSDRIKSWQYLKAPGSYTLFGLGAEAPPVHDLFSRILLSRGVVGLLLLIVTLGTLAWYLHRTLQRMEEGEDRAFSTFMLAMTATTIFVALIGGGNFTTVPINLQIWTFFGTVVAMLIQSAPVRTAINPYSVVQRPTPLQPLNRPPMLPGRAAGPVRS